MKQITSLLLFIALATTAGAQSNGYFNKVKAKQLEAHPSTGQLVIINDTDSEIFMNSNSSDSSLLPWMYHRLDSADLDAGTIDGTVIGGTTPAAGSFSTIDADGGTIDGTVIGGTVAASGSFSTTNIDGGTMDNTVIGSTTPAAGSFSTVDVDGGTIDGTVIGGTTPAAADFTNVTATAFNGVALSDGGSSTSFLNEEGNYITVAGAVSFGDENQIPTVNSSTDGYDYRDGLHFDLEPYDFLSIGIRGSFDMSAHDDTPNGLHITADLADIFVVGDENNLIYRLTMSTPGDINTISLTQSLDISGQDVNPRGVVLSPDGMELFMSGDENDAIYRFTLGTSRDLSTASFIHSLDVSSEDDTPRGIDISDDGTELFMGGMGSDVDIYRYTLSTPYNLTTETFIHSLAVSGIATNINGLSVSDDGTEVVFSSNSGSGIIHRLTLGTPYNLTTDTYIYAIDVSNQDTFPIGIDLSDDGSELYMTGITNDNIHKFSLSRLYTNSIEANRITSQPDFDLVLATEGAQALSIDDDQVVTIGANDLGTDHLHADDKLVISDGDDAGISVVATDGGTYGAYLALKQVDGTTFENGWYITRQTNGDGSGDGDFKISYGTDPDPSANTVWLSLSDGSGGLNLPGYAGTGTQDAQFTSVGSLTRITSDESTKKIYGKLEAGLDYVLATAKATIEYDYIDEEMNAKGYNYWGFGARYATKSAGKSPAFRPHEGVYYWDSKQMIAPLYNAVSELHYQNKEMRSWIVGLCLFLILQTAMFLLVTRKFIKQNN